MTEATNPVEKVEVEAGHLVEKVKELVHEGNVRRIIIMDSDGRTVLEIPVTIGIVGFLVAPSLAALGALGALAADYSIEVERAVPEPAETLRSPTT